MSGVHWLETCKINRNNLKQNTKSDTASSKLPFSFMFWSMFVINFTLTTWNDYQQLEISQHNAELIKWCSCGGEESHIKFLMDLSRNRIMVENNCSISSCNISKKNTNSIFRWNGNIDVEFNNTYLHELTCLTLNLLKIHTTFFIFGLRYHQATKSAEYNTIFIIKHWKNNGDQSLWL